MVPMHWHYMWWQLLSVQKINFTNFNWIRNFNMEASQFSILCRVFFVYDWIKWSGSAAYLYMWIVQLNGICTDLKASIGHFPLNKKKKRPTNNKSWPKYMRVHFVLKSHSYRSYLIRSKGHQIQSYELQICLLVHSDRFIRCAQLHSISRN